MTKILTYAKPYLGMVLLAISLLFIQALCDLALPDYMSDIINTGVLNGNTGFILSIGGKMLIITLFGTFISIIVSFLAAKIAAGMAQNLRYDIFQKVQSFSSAEFDKFSTASLITRTTNDISQIQTLVVMIVRMFFYAPILGVGGIIKAVSNSSSMSGILVIAILFLLGVATLIYIIAMPKMKKIQKLIDRLNLVVRENLDGLLVIRAFNSQKFERERFDKANVDLTKTNLFVNRASSIVMPVMMFIMNMTTVAIVWVGSKLVSSSNLDIGDMMAYMQYGLQVIIAFLIMAAMFIMIPRAAVSADRVAEVLKVTPSILDKQSLKTLSKGYIPNVEFKDVSFKYPGGDGNVLHHINFTAKHGETTAIIGATGSGKSTLVNLIVRFYDVTEGQILIGGVDIKDISQSELHDQIGYVPQKSSLFSGTINSNLYYADDGATRDNIEKAARVSQAAEFIDTMPEQYETPIAQGGTNVSGGQKQRLSIARALVKNAPIYIFDDSFSALDMKTDKKLRKSLKSETGDSTIFIVAQRISSIIDAQQIIVLDYGHIVGMGTHKELLKTCDIYREIAVSQLSEEELAR